MSSNDLIQNNDKNVDIVKEISEIADEFEALNMSQVGKIHTFRLDKELLEQNID